LLACWLAWLACWLAGILLPAHCAAVYVATIIIFRHGAFGAPKSSFFGAAPSAPQNPHFFGAAPSAPQNHHFFGMAPSAPLNPDFFGAAPSVRRTHFFPAWEPHFLPWHQ
jgi:hypothetical protein